MVIFHGPPKLEADGVVGVRLVFKQYAMDDGVLEFQAIGTAIRHRDRQGSFRTKDNRPFTSDLSGQDLWKLVRAGYRPVSLSMGACVYHIAHLSFMQALKQVGRNQEMKVYTEATYSAREFALERMQAEAVQRGGIGVVGYDTTDGGDDRQPDARPDSGPVGKPPESDQPSLCQ